jgi:MYXO-CTERM domain-containing protein
MDGDIGGTEMAEGDEVAKAYFLDRFGIETQPAVPIAPDPESLFILEDLGCDPKADVVPVEPGTVDACGDYLCETPISADGKCPGGMEMAAGCCYPTPEYNESGDVMVEPFNLVEEAGGVYEIPIEGATWGADSEFLFFKDNGATELGPPAFEPLNEDAYNSYATMSDSCDKDQAVISVFESRIKMPKSAELAGKQVSLIVHDSPFAKEGFKVSVNDHVVYYGDYHERQEGAVIPLTTAAAPVAADGTYNVRFVLLSRDCQGEPIELSYALTDADKFDDAGGSDGGGCSITVTGKTPATTGLVLLIGLFGIAFRRRRSRK